MNILDILNCRRKLRNQFFRRSVRHPNPALARAARGSEEAAVHRERYRLARMKDFTFVELIAAFGVPSLDGIRPCGGGEKGTAGIERGADDPIKSVKFSS